MAHDDRLQSIGRIGPQRIERRAIACVTKVIRELDDLRHAAEMFAQHDVLPKADFGVAIETALCGKSMMMRDAVKIMMLQISDSFISDANTVRADLLIIPTTTIFLACRTGKGFRYRVDWLRRR